NEAGGAMRFTVRLDNTNSESVRYQDYSATLESGGWRGTPEESAFSVRREVLTVPENIATLFLSLASGGLDETMGVMLIDDLKITVQPHPPKRQEQVLYQCDFETGADMNLESGTPEGWTRIGRRHEMQRVMPAGNSPANHALAVVDGGSRNMGIWNIRLPVEGRIQKGDRLVIEWKEMFSIGSGGIHTVNYRSVPSGKHVFRVMSVTPFGKPDGNNVALTVIIPLPFWRTPWFAALLLAASIAIFLLFLRQRLQRQLERLEWQQVVERERARIARDIHDDLGTSLTRISMLSASAGRPDDLREISGIARNMTLAMDEIVWAVAPENDSLDSLANYLSGYAQELLSSAGIRCRLDLPVELPAWNLSAEWRHNVFLAFKEALNNILKHANATEVQIKLAVESSRFELSLTDNGKGFETSPPGNQSPAARVGHGLTNMPKRLEKLGGKCAIESAAGKGTTVRLTVPAPAHKQ
ncbi:MAG: sensor histidine kinase, partial [Verrucomicrobia bacterium]|nr:sensor histidine kinase [Verrucomicrobiota bacterium]